MLNKNIELKIIPPLQLIIAAAMMFSLNYYLPSFTFQLSQTFKIIACCILLCISGLIGVAALWDFRKHNTTYHPHTPEKTSTVVNTGIYAYSRNPMYIALILVLVTVVVFLENITTLAVIPCFIWYLTRYQIIPEERMLMKLFGHDYQDYCKSVRRWL